MGLNNLIFYQSLFTRESADKLVQVQKDPSSGEVKTTVIREIQGDKLVQVNLA